MTIPKFRGWSISEENKGQLVYGNLIVDGNSAYIVNGVIECNDQYITIAEWCPVDPKTVGASTGLFDVNGKEIWEEDVVRMHSGELLPVRLHHGMFEPVCYYVSSVFEKVGNIFENPGLAEHPDFREANND
ncbi:YopX family protein [Streptococcus suis]|uniref:YopX family protein n=1 Tax=Streptococcus suis TaxID=1307 RepID=UPI0038B93753